MGTATRRVRRLTAVAATVLAALATVLVAVPLAPPAARAQPAGGCGTFAVGPGQWVSTGVYVEQNQRVQLSATGTLTVTQDVPQVPDPSRPGERDIAVKKGTTFGPGGTEVQWGFGLGTLSGFSLVARTAQYATKIGTKGEFTAGESGTLELGIASQRPPGGYGPEPADAGQVSGGFTVTLLAPCTSGQTAPASTVNARAAECGVPLLSNQEMDDIVARGNATGRSQEDIRQDLESLNRSRGGAGAATCPVPPPAGYAPPVNPTGPSAPPSPPTLPGTGDAAGDKSAWLIADAMIIVTGGLGLPMEVVDVLKVSECVDGAAKAGATSMELWRAYVLACYRGLLVAPGGTGGGPAPSAEPPPPPEAPAPPEPAQPPQPPGPTGISNENVAFTLSMLTFRIAEAFWIDPEAVDQMAVLSCYESALRYAQPGSLGKEVIACYGQMTGKTPHPEPPTLPPPAIPATTGFP